MVMFVIFTAVLVLMLIGVTTAVTMGGVSIATYLWAGGDPARLFLVAQRMYAQVSGITLMSIPFFLLMGNLMTVGGVSKASGASASATARAGLPTPPSSPASSWPPCRVRPRPARPGSA